MTKTELRHIAENLIEELREAPDGYEIRAQDPRQQGIRIYFDGHRPQSESTGLRIPA